VLVAGLVFSVVVTLLLSVAGPEPGTVRVQRRSASRG
jgi:hypothetical protein